LFAKKYFTDTQIRAKSLSSSPKPLAKPQLPYPLGFFGGVVIDQQELWLEGAEVPALVSTIAAPNPPTPILPSGPNSVVLLFDFGLPMQFSCPDCELRPFRPGDEPALARHANNRAVWLNLADEFPYPYTLEEAENWVKLNVGAPTQNNLAIVVAGQLVGGIGLKPLLGINRYTAEIGYWLGEAHWGRGLASQAVAALAHHALTEMGFRRLQARVFAHNPASMRVLEKNGFVREGILRLGACKNGQMVDEHLYARLRGS
jgi:RimJ/RimL family protein N-acetyltransferase